MFGHNKNVEIEETAEAEIIEKLYNDYKTVMYKEAYRILKDVGLAEDAVHQSFVKIIKNLPKMNIKDENKTRNLLLIIARNTAIDIYKNRLYLNQNSNSLDFELDEEDSGPIDFVEPSKVVIDRETINIVVEAIKKLPEIYRDVLLLEKVHGNTKEEIAELLNISYETTKKRSLRARKMLAESLEREELKWYEEWIFRWNTRKNN